MPKKYIERIDASNLHVYDIFNKNVSVENLVHIILNGRNNRKMSDLLSDLRKNNTLELMKKKIDSISLLYKFGATERNLNYLKSNNIYTVSELDSFLSDEGSVTVTSYGRTHFTLFKKILNDYDEWVSDNGDTIKMEFDVTNSELSSELVDDKKGNTSSKKELRYFGIDEFPKTSSEFMEMEFKNKNILEQIFQGHTLNEIGNEIGVSRERIRQIKLKIGEYIPEFDDITKYRNLFMNFDLSKEDFIFLTGQTAEIYDFLKLKYGKGGRESIDQYVLQSPVMSTETKKDFFSKKNLLLTTQGSLIEVSRVNIMEDVLKSNRGVLDVHSYKELITKYIQENNLSEKFLITSERSLSNNIDRLSAIRQTSGLFRYYDISIVDDYKDELINLFDGEDGIYGIEYFYDLDSSLMEAIDIRNSSELANLVKQIGYDKFPRIKKIERQSQVWIGDITPETFYKNLLMKFDNKSLDNLMEYIQVNYKLNIDSVKSLVTTNYKEYVHDNIVSFFVELPKDVKFYDECKKKLNRSIYSFDMISYVIKAIDPTVDVTPQLLAKLDFYERGSVVVNKKFSKQQDAIDSYLLDRDYVSADDIAQYHSRSINSEVYSLELSHDLLKISDNKYMTISKFESAGFSKNDITEFLNKIKGFVKVGQFFSWKTLMDDGFDSPLIMRTGFNQDFFERLIFTMDNVRTIQTRVPIFVMSENRPSESSILPLSDLFEQIMNKDSENIDEFSDYLKDRYGLDLDIDKIVAKVRDSNLEYSAEMKKIYKNEKCMLDNIYGQ